MNQQKGKRELINSANSRMVAVVALGAFLIIFSLVASKALWTQKSFQGRVISKKEKAVKQLEDNQKAVDQLKVSFATFNNGSDNIIGGNPKGTGDRDGDNAKIVLDALPSKYDFPAFITSMKKLLASKNLSPKSITGSDDEVNQNSKPAKDPIEIPFQLTGETDSFSKAKDFLVAFEQSIRPVKIKKISVTGGGQGVQLQFNIDAVSYFQAGKGLTITKEVVKQ